jgi:hypothetical protein
LNFFLHCCQMFLLPVRARCFLKECLSAHSHCEDHQESSLQESLHLSVKNH